MKVEPVWVAKNFNYEALSFIGGNWYESEDRKRGIKRGENGKKKFVDAGTQLLPEAARRGKNRLGRKTGLS